MTLRELTIKLQQLLAQEDGDLEVWALDQKLTDVRLYESQEDKQRLQVVLV